MVYFEFTLTRKTLFFTLQVTATGARGASSSLVGSYETVANALVEYTKIGVDIISIRGYNNFEDAVGYVVHALLLLFLHY